MNKPRVKAAITVLLSVALMILIFRLGDQASADVQLDDPTVWAEHGLAGEVIQISASNGEILSRVSVSAPGDRIHAVPVGSGAIVLNHSANTVRHVDAITLRASDPVDLTLPPSDGEPGAAIVASSTSADAYVMGFGGTLRIDSRSLDQTSIDSPEVDEGILDDEDRLLAIDRSGAFVRRLGPNGFGPFVPLAARDDGAPEPKLVRAGDAVYVVQQDRLAVSELRADGTLGPATCLTGSVGSSLIAGTTDTQKSELRVVVHDPRNGTLSVSEPDRQQCFEIDLDFVGAHYGSPVVMGDWVYLPNWDLGRIDVVDMTTRRSAGSVSFSSIPGERFELEAFGSTVLANEPQGPFAAILDGTDAHTVQKLESVVVGSGRNADERGFGAATPLIAIADGADGTQALGTSGDQVGGGDGEEPGDGTEDPIDADVLGVAIESTDQVENPDGLTADFGFSSSVVAVGEVVRFVDQSLGSPVDWLWDFGDGSASTEPDVDKAWTAPGEYKVQLSVTDAGGAQSGSSTVITVVSDASTLPPVADFVFETAVIEVGAPLEFTSLTTGDPDVLEWEFGDGNVDVGAQVTHTFLDVGEYTVTLVASNGAGSTTASTIITVIEATKPPVAAMRPLPRRIEVGQFVALESVSLNDPTLTVWDFGDGEGGSSPFVRHAWARPGSYRVRLSVGNSAGDDTTVADITVVPRVDPPDARFTETARATLVGEPIAFTDLSSNSPTSIEWDFGDGTTATGGEVSHAWNRSGTFEVTLRAANDAGRDRRMKTIRVIDPVDPPIAAFEASSTRAPLGSSIQFSDTSRNEPVRWLWAFGDGTTSTAQFPSHTYAEPGTYSVRLRVSNKGGVATTDRSVVVYGPPVAAFDIQTIGLQAIFWDKTTGDPTSWTWAASDGSRSSAQNPEITFDEPGTYEMTLVAANAAGTSSPLTRSITVYDDPDARYGYIEEFLTVIFDNQSRGGPTDYLWDFGDGNTSTDEDPTHTYAESGAYDVTLTASNPTGSDSIEKTIRVQAEPLEADFACDVDGATIVCDAARSTGETSYGWSAAGALSIDGADEQVATFTFPPCGRYAIVLDVANDDGDTDRRTRRTPSLGDESVPEVTEVEVESNEDLAVQLLGRSRNSPDTWAWSIPGGELVEGGGTRRPIFLFTDPGNYAGTVTASNECGTSDTFAFDITVVGPVDPDAAE